MPNPSPPSSASGQLRIYFGAALGVGKTQAMLTAAESLARDGVDVLLGVKLALSSSLTLLPSAQDGTEFDLAAALQRHPALIVLPQMAHANPAGSANRQRWQDIQQLLAAGIDVFTTAQVQDIASLNPVVASITGHAVSSTMPDAVFDSANEIVLVDIALDAWQKRIAADASLNQGNFRTGNLIALRELALRRSAERIGKVDPTIERPPSLPASGGLLVCLGTADNTGFDAMLQAAARLAQQMRCPWHVIYVEGPLAPTPRQRSRLRQHLQLAEQLGAKIVVLSHQNMAQAIIDYARSQQFAHLAFGRSARPWYAQWPWRPDLVGEIATLAPELDLIELGPPPGHASEAEAPATSLPSRASRNARPIKQRRYLLAAGAALAMALFTIPLAPFLELANIAMLFLLTVVLVSLRYGRRASVIATLIGVATMALVIPQFALAANRMQLILTFFVMLAVGLLIGRLTANLRYQVSLAARREARSLALYEFARSLSGVLQTEQIFDITRNFIQQTFHARATLILPDMAGRLQYPGQSNEHGSTQAHLSVLEMNTAQWAFDQAQAAGAGTQMMAENRFFFLPLVAPMRTRGILAILPQQGGWDLLPEQRKQLDTFAALAAIALERVHYIEVAQEALLHMESERLRNSLLAALSHDLRTPLTSLVGLSESLALSNPPLSSVQMELANSLRDEALRMSNLVANLLDMARMQNGQINLNLQWQFLEEVVGSALRAAHTHLRAHQVQTQLAPNLPLVRFDAVLIERVLVNLLENAVKYTPAGSTIRIHGEIAGSFLQVSVQDNGPGVASGLEEAIFEKFTRGEKESNKPGVGLGLSICRAVIEAHKGKIYLSPSVATGACFVFTLPLGTPPELPCIDDIAFSEE
ncbi:MAG: DUF4118 domain-containing protein [Burkholderiales bacterium]|nr:DUF4118 domain-containing protein [Burkholderiales bacterium]